MSVPRILIAGCGFVGLAAARLFHRNGWDVIGCTHSVESALGLKEPFRVVACDIADVEAVRVAEGFCGLDAVIHCASSGKGGADAYRRVYLGGARNLAEIARPKRLLFTSSTSVYAQTTGEWVNEESAAAPDRETGRVLMETEDLVLSTGGIVARLAGIYGPGRSVMLRKFLSGEATIEGDGSRWINQAHRDDIATALWTLVTLGAAGIYNVTDDTPVTQRSLYVALADRFARPLPPSGEIPVDRKRGWTHKRVSNAKLRALGWAPKYPSFQMAVETDPELSDGRASP